MDRIIESSSSDDVGAVIVEPYEGTAGFVFPPDGWLNELEKWARGRNLLLIVDEVQASFGRTGKMYAIEWENVHPQMLCLGKGLGSGVACSALAGESKVLKCMSPGELSSTWGGNPVSSAAALAVLDAMEKEKLPQNALRIGEHIKPRLLEMKKRYRCLGDVRGRGLVMGLEFVNPKDQWTPSPDLTRRFIYACAEQGLLLGKVGVHGNVVRIAPPLVITMEEADMALDIIESGLKRVSKPG
jgi:4-aminobutyrate aminotransferase-like enzyme